MIQLSAPGRDGAVLAFSDPDSATDHGYAEGWTDGLPFLLPTTGRVDGLLAAVGGDPDRPLGAGRWPGLTARAVAWNAALGGCSPAHVPVLLAAVEALTDPLFGLDRLLQATSAWAPLAIVSGPAVRALGFNSRDGVFGGGSRANVAVGRTIRLLLWNVMGARGGPAFGHPGAASFCIAEDPDANPWEPFHTTVAGGVEGAGSAVTVFACEANHNVCDTHNDRPERLLDTIVDGLSTLGNRVTQAGGETLVVAGPERARVFAAEGWSRAAVQRSI